MQTVSFFQAVGNQQFSPDCPDFFLSGTQQQDRVKNYSFYKGALYYIFAGRVFFVCISCERQIFFKKLQKLTVIIILPDLMSPSYFYLTYAFAGGAKKSPLNS